MNDRKARYEALQEALNQRILVLDGAMGTMIHQRNLTPADFGGPKQDNCPEQLVRTRPDVIEDIHRAYYAAGSDIVETNSPTLPRCGHVTSLKCASRLASQLLKGQGQRMPSASTS